MKAGLIYFLSRPCKILEHKLCHGYWLGFGFEYACECFCHQGKNEATERFSKLISDALNTPSLELPKMAENTLLRPGIKVFHQNTVDTRIKR